VQHAEVLEISADAVPDLADGVVGAAERERGNISSRYT
jgi:hypothetical protein